MTLADILNPDNINTAAKVIAGASMIAAATPTKKDDRYLGWVVKLINLVAFNFGNAKNAKDN